jgi:protein TonB
MSTLPPLPSSSYDALPPAARHGLVVGLVVVHVAGAWALLQLQTVREALGERRPIEVQIFTPEAPRPEPPPPPPRPVPRAPAPPQRLLTAPPPPEPEPAPFIAAPAPEIPAPVAPPAPEPVAVAPAPPPAPPAPPSPKELRIDQIQYVTPPVMTYPSAARRAREQGQVHVRLTIDERGVPQQLRVTRPSGSDRLDEACLATARATRFKPYMENGVPRAATTTMPCIFELEN